MTKRRFNKTSKCRFCRMGVEEVDYKDSQNLPKLTTSQGGRLQRHAKFTKTYDESGKTFFEKTFRKLCSSSAFRKGVYQKSEIYGIASICGIGGDNHGIVVEEECR